MLFWIGRFIFFVVFKLFFSLKVYGRENIPVRGGFIVAGNHVSNIDPILIGISVPRAINFMAKRELFKNRLFGYVLRQVHAFPVRRKEADVGAIKEAIRRLRLGQGLLLFPQGGRGQSQLVEEGKDGVGMFAVKMGIPVVPAAIGGSGESLPRGKIIPRRTRLRVYFGPAISADKNSNKDYHAVTQKVIAGINRLIGDNLLAD